MSEWEELAEAKVRAREQINSLPPKQAQVIVNDVIRADLWQPELPDDKDNDNSIPVPKFLMPDADS